MGWRQCEGGKEGKEKNARSPPLHSFFLSRSTPLLHGRWRAHRTARHRARARPRSPGGDRCDGGVCVCVAWGGEREGRHDSAPLRCACPHPSTPSPPPATLHTILFCRLLGATRPVDAVADQFGLTYVSRGVGEKREREKREDERGKSMRHSALSQPNPLPPSPLSPGHRRRSGRLLGRRLQGRLRRGLVRPAPRPPGGGAAVPI